MTWGLSIFFYFLNKAGPGSPQILVRSVSTWDPHQHEAGQKLIVAQMIDY